MTSGLGITERYTRVMRPPQSKRDEDVMGNLENWERECRELNELDERGADMSDKMKMTAMKCILPANSKLRDFIEEREDELNMLERHVSM